MAKKNFFIFSADHSGLPLATRLKEEGNSVTLVTIRPEEREGKFTRPKTPDEAKKNAERVKYLNKNGNGLVDKIWAPEAMRRIRKGDRVIFDQIYGWQYGDALHKRGIEVLGGSKVGYTLETERRDTLAMLKKMGLDVPLQKYFGPKSVKTGIEFLNNAKDEMLFVFKSDNPKVETLVAHDSNEELIQKMQAEAKDIDGDGYLLQQKVDGVEFAVETWYSKGTPIFANIDIEAKKKYNEMCEVQTGCSFGVTWPIPVDHPLRERVNGPLDKFAAKYVGTGLLDVSVIYDSKEDKMYALEMCGARFAYNALYALMALCNIPLSQFFADYLEGKYTKDIIGKVFQEKYAASLRVFNNENSPDQRIEIPKEYRHCFWLWDCHKRGKDLFTTGGTLGESLGIITAIGENPEGAFAEVRKNFFKLNMTTKWARSDFQEDDEPTLPLNRFHMMERLNLI
jgi:phosphoribosylamine-glycine ligase